MDTRKLYAKRIRHVCTFLSNGGGTLKEMLAWVNRGLRAQQLREIELRTLQHCIYLLRQGDFEHARQDDPPAVRRQLFKLQVVGKRTYRWAPGSEVPVFGDLDEDERFTLPFLAGILERYRSIPAVEKILDKLPELFNLREDEMRSRSAIVHSGPVLYDEDNDLFQEKVIGCVVKILSHIHRGECIQINYSNVEKGEAEWKLHEVAPLQIRYYEHYYYLIAADLEGKKLMSYRVDRINRLRVDQYLDDADQPRSFDRAAYETQVNLHERFRDSLGVWAHRIEVEKPHLVEVLFKGWAAGYVRHLKLHPSQRIVRSDPAENTLVICLKLRLEKEDSPGQPITHRNRELAFLLGRFRGAAEVVSCRPL